ncbi:malto-oligosyltrehalose synthase [Novosphingobium malaysiense]|uniref:malto-oligosyltrehalose synthase n=1 Tax=Novosphingobium malaysiense TaxID=1348853 RepID=UPI000689697F|nr:malto-oligosyltrehalose synthase [Novosphingobium malaysiense]
MTPRATYRLQFHKDFTFTDALGIVAYLDELGVSHVYSSPITTARRGSLHGYDVTDPTRVNPELGGEPGLRQLAAALREREMGLIIDIVPNHMGVAGGENHWWQDVLRNGQASSYARYFDIDWRDPLLLPVLGGTLAAAITDGHLRLVEADGTRHLQLYGETLYPLRPDDPVHGIADALALHDPATEIGREALAVLAGRQHYRLAYWRTANDRINWRRFFSINELAGLRAEDPAVFEATHALPFRLFGEGIIDGVRVDHIDGLTDPAGYCRKLSEGLMSAAEGRRPYIVVEKILAPGEQVPADWPIEGTSGYDFMREATALLHDSSGLVRLRALWTEISGRPPDFAAEELSARQQLLAWQFESQLEACVEAFTELTTTIEDLAWIPRPMLRRAIERLLWVFPVYRTYGTGTDAPPEDASVREAARKGAQALAGPGEASIVAQVLEWLAGTGPGDPEIAAQAVRKFQQLSAPIAAKAVEDTAFYRHGVLLSCNEVGSDPAHGALSINEFHAAMASRAAKQPHAMLSLATHDHKRGPDARARLAVLSGTPDIWASHARDWLTYAGDSETGVDPSDLYMLLQTLVGAWDDNARSAPSAFLSRIHAWQEKALREAKVRSSWAAPDLEYEARCKTLAADLLTDERHADFRQSFAAFMRKLAPAAEANSLAQTALQFLAPGVPDIYQGSELEDFSLVDPDNRRPVDYDCRRNLLANVSGPADLSAKPYLIRNMLALRRRHPSLFARGDYRPLSVEGPRAEHILAFVRSEGEMRLECAIAVRLAEALVDGTAKCPKAEWWDDTRIVTGDGGMLAAAEAFANGVVYTNLVP